MTASPEWATWSLESSKTMPPAVIVTHHELTTPADAQIDNINEGATLFKKTALDNVDNTDWQDFDEDRNSIQEMQLDSTILAVLDTVDVDDLFSEGNESRKDSNVGLQERELPNISMFHFDPLSPVESRALQRALKLSKYIPPSAQEIEEEKQRTMNAKRVANGASRGTTKSKETGKRVYNVAARGTGLVLKENNEAKDIFKAMCKSMLPHRYFDWILAQLIYHKCDMIGFDDIPSSRTLLQREAKESIRNETMSMHNLAHVTRLLAEASKIDTSPYDIVDPTRAARLKGHPSTKVKNTMMLQSKAIFDVLKELFPAQFQSDSTFESSRLESEMKESKSFV